MFMIVLKAERLGEIKLEVIYRVLDLLKLCVELYWLDGEVKTFLKHFLKSSSDFFSPSSLLRRAKG